MSAVALALAALMVVAAPALAKKTYPPVHPDISCPGDPIVWVNTASRVYHYQGERWFGRTEHGQFECEKAARKEGDRPTKNGQ
ncbi:MAG: hypothetical protein HIU92_02530 [Proteobacteria bacterium]|nr:hypothetical protein [Pseudomonadota bacterium]